MGAKSSWPRHVLERGRNGAGGEAKAAHRNLSIFKSAVGTHILSSGRALNHGNVTLSRSTCKTVERLQDHHLSAWLQQNQPLVICVSRGIPKTFDS